MSTSSWESDPPECQFLAYSVENPFSASEKFLAAMRGFVISDIRGHK
jgi:hypothetical protein